MIHYEEIDRYYQGNLPNFTNPLVLKIEDVNDTFTFNEATGQPERLHFVEAMRKEIGSHENDKHYTLVIRRELNGNKTIMSVWSFKRKRYPYGGVIKHKARL